MLDSKISINNKSLTDKSSFSGLSNLLVLFGIISVLGYSIHCVSSLNRNLFNSKFGLFELRDLLHFLVFSFIQLSISFCVYFIRNGFISYMILFISEIFLTLCIFIHFSSISLCLLLHSQSILFTLKLFSYIHCRKSVNLFKFAIFLIYPTIIFKDSYEQKEKRSFLNVFLYLFNFVCSSLVLLVIKVIIIIPLLSGILNSKGFMPCFPQILALSMFSSICFCLIFNLFFNGFLKFLCEITKYNGLIFGPWWNAQSSQEFWHYWNVPVNNFFKYHIFIPMLNRGYSKAFSSAICFIISGILHEFILSLSLKSFNGYFFLGMIGQIPLHAISMAVYGRYRNIANYFFWVMFCIIGQPILLYLIVESYCRQHGIHLNVTVK